MKKLSIPTCTYCRGVVDADPPPPEQRLFTYCECERPFLPSEHDAPPPQGGEAWRAVQGRKKSQPVLTPSAVAPVVARVPVPYPAKTEKPTIAAERCPACLRAKAEENRQFGIDSQLCVCVPIPRAERDRLNAVEAQARRLLEAIDCLRGLVREQ